MTGKPACALGAEGTAELRENVQSTSCASVLDLSRPKRNEPRQIALPHISASAGVGHTRVNSRGG
jgi:hypothetical protein